MNTKRIFITGLTIGAFSLAPAAFAEEGSQAEKDMKSSTPQESSETMGSERTGAAESSRQTEEQAAQESHPLRASEVVGYTVKNAEGQELGEIEDLVIDPEHGRIAYAVLSFGGFLGMGDKLFAIPWDAVKPLPAQETVMFDVTKEKLENAPGFDKNNWPDMANREWGSKVYKYYDQEPYWQ